MIDITVEKGGTITIAKMGKRVDYDNAITYEETLVNLLNEGTQNLLLDFSDTVFLGSAGIRVLLIVAKKIKKSDGMFGLCYTNSNVFEVIKADGFNNIFRMFPTREEGMLRFLSP